MGGSDVETNEFGSDEQLHFTNRTSAKGGLTRIINYVAKYDPVTESIEEITVRLSGVEKAWEKYDKAQSHLEHLDFEKYGNDREEIENKYYSLKASMLGLIKSVTAEAKLQSSLSSIPSPVSMPASSVTSIVTSTTNTFTSTVSNIALNAASFTSSQSSTTLASSQNTAPVQTTSVDNQTRVSTNHPITTLGQLSVESPVLSVTDNSQISSKTKLPSLSIPQFTGVYEEWRGFIELFDAMVHESSQIATVQKFFYLKRALTGEPSTIIESLSTTAENYATARQLLFERYENKPVILNAHLKAIFGIASINKESTVGLRKLTTDVKQHLRAIEALGCHIENWDPIIIFIMKQKLDPSSKRQWELGNRDPGQFPTLEQFYRFLEQRCFALEALQSQVDEKIKTKPSNKSLATHVVSEEHTTNNCPLCKGTHFLSQCSGFRDKPISEKMEMVTKNRLCFNCLRSGHNCKNCKSRHCLKCPKYHHTLLHTDKPRTETTSVAIPPNETNNQIALSGIVDQYSHQVLLATAMIKIRDINGKWQACRALLDSGSQAHFVSLKMVEKLGLKKRPFNVPIIGINQTKSRVNQFAEITISSRVTPFNVTINCLIIPTITSNLPSFNITHQRLNLPAVQLADPTFFESQEIDLLIGAELYFDILRTERIKLGPGLPVLQDSELGWIVSGKIEITRRHNPTSSNITCLLSLTDLSNDIERFWQTEEIKEICHLSEEEKLCEKHFVETFQRDENGRFELKLPFKDNPEKLGDSKHAAMQRLLAMERRMNRDSDFKTRYIQFMQEYESLGHMSKITNELDNDNSIYLPHHGVKREDSCTTKLRVVFDGSNKTETGIALNEILMKGPKVQSELFDILLRFREYKYVMSADIEKMFRQIRIQEEDRHYQRILWRESPEDSVLTYSLNTVTYGLTSSPYQSVRCLKQLAIENYKNYPEASRIIDEDFYVDDMLTGADSLSEALIRKQEVVAILESAHFKLRKWRSNDKELLKRELAESTILDFSVASGEINKTLGIIWDSEIDVIKYNTSNLEKKECITKRQLLSQIAKLYDPLGLIQPILMTAKQIMQTLWKLQVDWDSPVPISIQNKWLKIIEQLPVLNTLKISRYIPVSEQDSELHVFADASEKGYGAALYIRSQIEKSQFHTRLICSKSRVAPLKTISLPRLELCAAVVAARLLTAVRKVLRKSINRVYCWSDSEITLHWIKTQPYKLQTFVANRVAEIQNLTSDCKWNHVMSAENPADYVSRGLEPEQLIKADKWWGGPTFLQQPESLWPVSKVMNDFKASELEFKSTVVTMTVSKENEEFKRFSSWKKLIRVIALCLRWIHNTQNKNTKSIGALSIHELESTKVRVLKLVQKERFEDELKVLEKGEPLLRCSKLLTLNPFLDSNGLLRVGGRLKNSEIDPERKHPILLPSKHHITKIIMRDRHQELMHCGSEQLLSSIRMLYWPVSGRSLARQITKECMSCARFNPKPFKYLMSDLPKDRLNCFVRVFSVTGLDYAGPFQIRESKKRGRLTTSKAYVAVFICFSTRAIHLELVSSLTTDSFLSALKRFIGRRGICNKIVSDNAKTFVGADQRLKEMYKFINDNTEEISNYLCNQKIDWSFIPPRAPHFGGLWEAAVKSFKKHFYKVAHSHIFTFEEFNTLMIQIEAILNSRPLMPLSSDPNDLNSLTPSHFLIGDNLLEPPEVSFRSVPDNRLTRFQLIQKIREHFWTRWKNEYVHTLQTRSKWKFVTPNIKVNDLVLIVDENSRPLQWPLGRITQVYPGPDGIVRVVTVKTVNGEYKRATGKLCLLPSPSEEENCRED